MQCFDIVVVCVVPLYYFVCLAWPGRHLMVRAEEVGAGMTNCRQAEPITAPRKPEVSTR